MQVFCWRTLRVGEYGGMLGRVHLVRWAGDNKWTLCLPDEFDIPLRINL